MCLCTAIEQGEPSKALKQGKTLVPVAESITTPQRAVLLGNLHSVMGTAHFEAGDLTAASEAFNKDLALAKQSGDKGALGRALGNQGRVYARQGQFRKVWDVGVMWSFRVVFEFFVSCVFYNVEWHTSPA
jgi:uncharacterized protein HemY